MTGTFGGALEARGIPAGEGHLESDTIGEIEKEGNVLVIKRINITYKLKIDPEILDKSETPSTALCAYTPPPAPSIGAYRAVSTFRRRWIWFEENHKRSRRIE